MKNLSVQYRKHVDDLESKAMREVKKRDQQASYEKKQSEIQKQGRIQKQIEYSRRVMEFHKPAASERVQQEVDSKKAEFFNSRTTWHQGKTLHNTSRRESQCDDSTSLNPNSEKAPRTSAENIR